MAGRTTTFAYGRSRKGHSIGIRARALAWGLGLCLHTIMLAAILLTGSEAMLRGAETRLGEGDAVEVSLSGWEGAAARRRQGVVATETDSSQLDRLVERLREANSPLYAVQENRQPPHGSIADLFDAPPSAVGKGRRGEGQDAAGPREADGVHANTALSSSVGDGASGDSSGGGLWRQIEPCWSRLPRSSGVSVTLEVSLSGSGRLAKPPRILRPMVGSPDEQRLVAEARALQAISACLPYGGVEGLGRTQQVVFPESRSR